MLDNNTIIEIVKKEIRQNKNLNLDIKPSKTTNSLYFTLSNGNVEQFFRISDHLCGKASAHSIIISKSTKAATISHFVKNNINKLQQKNMYTLLKSIGKK